MRLQLRSLRVLNCGPLRDVCIHFNTEGDCPVTVLAGANGSGKTTALELIAALAELLDPDVRRKLIPAILQRTTYAQMDWLVDGEEFVFFYGQPPGPETHFGNNVYGRINNFGRFAEVGEGPVLAVLRKMIPHLRKTTIEFPYVGPLVTAGVDAFASLFLFPCQRVISPISGEQLRREDVRGEWVYRFENIPAYKGSYDSYLIWLEYAEPENYARAIEFLDGLNFDGKKFGINRRELKVVVTTRDGGTHYLEELSSGEQNILVMLLELRRRLLPGSIVLIDEIENSLHPAFQYRIAEGLKRLQEMVPFQLIVTTHSPTFVEIFGTASTRILTEF